MRLQKNTGPLVCRKIPFISILPVQPARVLVRLTRNGVTLELEGDANDYFGKGLSGARLIIYPSREASIYPGKQQHYW